MKLLKKAKYMIWPCIKEQNLINLNDNKKKLIKFFKILKNLHHFSEVSPIKYTGLKLI